MKWTGVADDRWLTRLASCRPILLLCLAASVAGCDGVAGSADGGADARILADRSAADRSAEALPDSELNDAAIDVTSLDGPPDGAADDAPRGVDTAADLQPPDVSPLDTGGPADSVPSDAGSDAAPTTGVENVLYTLGASYDKITLEQIKTDGAGKHDVPGVPTDFDIIGMQLSGPREPAQVTRHLPNPIAQASGVFRGVHLPGGNGRLYYISTPPPTPSRGFLKIGLNGAVTVLATYPGTLADSYHTNIGVRRDGTMIAAVRAFNSPTNAGVVLIRTDGKTFTGGLVSCELTPAVKISKISSASLTFAKQHLYFVARDVSTDQPYLLRAPLDCSGKAAKVSLPLVGAVAPTTIDARIAISDDLGTLAFLAGSSAGSEDVIAVDDATGAAVNVSDSPGDMQPRGENPLNFNMSHGTKLAVSTGGKNVAWIVRTSSPTNYELYVRPTDKSAAARNVTGDAAFATIVRYVAGLLWASDDDLLFAADKTPSAAADLFAVEASAGAVTNLTKTGGGATPLPGGATIKPIGGWTSPNGKWAYFMRYQYKSSGTTSDIIGVHRQTLQLKAITSGLFVDYSSTNVKAAATGASVFFAARPNGKTYPEDVHVFDQQAAGQAKKLTSLTGSTTKAFSIVPSKDGARVAFGAGASLSSQDLYVVEVGAVPAVHALTTGGYYLAGMKRFTSDGKAIVYGLGSFNSTVALRVQPVAGGPPKVLDPGPGFGTVFAVWK